MFDAPARRTNQMDTKIALQISEEDFEWLLEEADKLGISKQKLVERLLKAAMITMDTDDDFRDMIGRYRYHRPR